MEILVRTSTGCQYKINEDAKNVSGGYFGSKTVPYRRVVSFGAGSQMIFLTEDEQVITAPVKSMLKVG